MFRAAAELPRSYVESIMKERILTIPEIALIAGTRVALGAGAGLLLAGKMNDSKRQGAGWALFAVGVLTTIPLAIGVLNQKRQENRLAA
jgi:hypothetical protein